MIEAAHAGVEGRGFAVVATLVDIDFDAYRRANDLRTVRKNVTIPSWLNSLAENAGINSSQILQEGLKFR